MLGTRLELGVIINILNALGPDLRETEVNCVSVSNDKKLLAVADAINRVRVFCYPAYLPKQ